MYRKTGALPWDECASKQVGLIQIYSNKTVLCPWASLPGRVFLDADGPSLKAVELAEVRRLFWSFFLSH